MATTRAGTEKRGTTFTRPSDLEVRAIHEVHAPRELVWACHTQPEHVSKWLLGPDGWTMPICEIDLRPGGKWRWVWRKADGSEQFEMTGEYREIVPPEKLVNTERWGGEFPEAIDTLLLSEKDGVTTISWTARWPTKEARDAAIATGMESGWAASNDRLEQYLTTLV